MKVLVLGGTGSIGGAIVDILQERNHDVFALGRSPEACKLLECAGATPVTGDIENPCNWIDICDSIDGVVHAAAVRRDKMGTIDRQVVEAVLSRLSSEASPKAFIYTGGCWLYGETGNSIATEETIFNPLASFAWTIPTMQSVLSAKFVRGMVIHPAMVYERDGGVFEHIFEDAKKLGYVRVIRGEHVRWPLIHRMDLARLYVSMLEQGKHGNVYNGATNHGVTIGEITRTIAKRLGIDSDPVVLDTKTAIREIGSWAEGYAIDQQMSGEKARIQLGWCPDYEDIISEIA